jgi:hypothetical protein
MVRAYPRIAARKDGLMSPHRETLRRLAMNDEDFIKRFLSIGLTDEDTSGLDPTSHAVARLGALIALASGVTVDEIVGVLVAVAPIVGVARVVSAAQGVALAIGYDIDADLEAVAPLNG